MANHGACCGGVGVGLNYADAVRLMGGQQSKTVAALDRLAGGLLLAASAAGSGFALSLFEAKGELARLSGELVQELGERWRGLDRFTRTERLAAAHSVVVLTAYFEALARVDLPFDARELELTKPEQVALAGGGLPGPERLGALAAGLLRAEVPMPAPQYPYELTMEAMGGFYEDLSDVLSRFVAGLAVYERLDEPGRRRFAGALSQVPDRALRRYEELFRQLAVQFPEVAFWANLVDHQATREEIRRLGSGLEDLEKILAGLAAGRVPDHRRLGLARAYRAALGRPVLTTGEAPPGVRLPTLGEAYVQPAFRVAEMVAAGRLAEESWWEEQPVRSDLEGFLAGHLTAPQATAAPLLVLGQPGSGKSVLTQVLAARLPPEEFLVVRVLLREVAADADVQTQIEHAIRSATGESLAWPDLARSAGGALAVVLLDGFDELLQATGISQTDYLRKAAAFQAREADQGRPVAVLVTSRTAVADRAQPVPGLVVLRLEPFSDPHIRRWLEIWNATNTTRFAADGVQPLTPQTVLAYAELASQPLLLLMLALYDADGNPLQCGASLAKADLYERLLTRFAEREVGKSAGALPPGEAARLVNKELLRLSVVAFATFNRGRQWVTEAELDADLAVLLDDPDSPAVPAGMQARLSAAQTVAGRFFFIYQAQATRDDTLLRTFEFLHATFGEYLIARLVARELADLAEAMQTAVSRSRPAPVSDAFLHALLSYMPLTMRGTVVSFLAEQLQALPGRQRHYMGAVLAGLFRESLSPRQDIRYEGYIPQTSFPVPARYAAYSANLLLLIVFTVGEVTGTGLFPAAEDPVHDWRQRALLWRSQLPLEGWTGLIEAITVDRVWDRDQRNIILHASQVSDPTAWIPDPFWNLDVGPGHGQRARGPGDRSIWVHRNDNAWLRAQARFTCDAGDDILAHALDPLASDLGPAVTTFHSYGANPHRAVSAANALITLWLASSKASNPDELATAYGTCLNIAIHGFAPYDTSAYERFRLLILRQLAADQHRLPAAWLDSAARELREARNNDRRQGSELLRMANQMLPELMSALPSDPAAARPFPQPRTLRDTHPEPDHSL